MLRTSPCASPCAFGSTTRALDGGPGWPLRAPLVLSVRELNPPAAELGRTPAKSSRRGVDGCPPQHLAHCGLRRRVDGVGGVIATEVSTCAWCKVWPPSSYDGGDLRTSNAVHFALAFACNSGPPIACKCRRSPRSQIEGGQIGSFRIASPRRQRAVALLGAMVLAPKFKPPNLPRLGAAGYRH